MISFPKDTAQLSWTRHIKNKMVFYHLSGAQLLRIFRKPDRREEGIAPATIAAMKRILHNSKVKSTSDGKQTEIWIMYKLNPRGARNDRGDTKGNAKLITHTSLLKSRVTMISAWRYPGITKKGERPIIPEDVLAELEEAAL